MRRFGDIPILAPAGRITIGESAAALKAALEAAVDSGTRDLILDASQIPYIDSTGLGELIATGRRLSELGRGRVGIAAPSPKLLEILEITGLKAIFVVGMGEKEVAGALAAGPAPRSGI